MGHSANSSAKHDLVDVPFSVKLTPPVIGIFNSTNVMMEASKEKGRVVVPTTPAMVTGEKPGILCTSRR